MSLKGKVVAITRPLGQAEELAEIIAERGGIPRITPTVEIKPVIDLHAVREFADRMIAGRVDYVVFMSRNAVAHLTKALNGLGLMEEVAESFDRAKIVAIGPGTKRELEDQGLRADFTPSDYSSGGIVQLLWRMGLRGKNTVVLRAGDRSEYLKRELEGRFAHVLEVPVYESAPPSDKTGVSGLIDDLLRGKIDVIAFTSSATARNLFEVAEERGLSRELAACLGHKVVVAAIGPATQRALEELGVKVQVVPREYTVGAMAAALEDYLRYRAIKSRKPDWVGEAHGP